MKIGEFAYVLINVRDLDVSSEFWCSVLGREAGQSYGPYVELSEPGKITITLQKVDSDYLEGSMNTHIDIKVTDLDKAVQEVVAIGGKLVEHKSKDRWRWAIMSDPDGNLFCLV